MNSIKELKDFYQRELDKILKNCGVDEIRQIKDLSTKVDAQGLRQFISDLNLLPKNEINWIDVNKDLPEKGQKVLCVQNPKTTATREALFGVFNGKDFMPPTPMTFATLEVGQSKWVDIIYWMPIPATPNQN